jgi:hypothetical protein
MDRGGNPTINPFINPDGEKNLYNSRQPADDVANYLGPWSQLLEKGGYSPQEAREAAMQVLPDILRYDRTKPVSYPNGRKIIDDVYSYRFAWLSHGKLPPKPPCSPLWVGRASIATAETCRNTSSSRGVRPIESAAEVPVAA